MEHSEKKGQLYKFTKPTHPIQKISYVPQVKITECPSLL